MSNEQEIAEGFAAGEVCNADPQDATHGKELGPDVFAWHLDKDHSQLGSAREAVEFKDPRTRIAHIDTGYYRTHDTVPERILRHLERSFVEGDADRRSAEDPDNRAFLIDNSGHGTGTIGILAGGKAPAFGGVYLGGAPDAEVVPLRSRRPRRPAPHERARAGIQLRRRAALRRHDVEHGRRAFARVGRGRGQGLRGGRRDSAPRRATTSAFRRRTRSSIPRVTRASSPSAA